MGRGIGQYWPSGSGTRETQYKMAAVLEEEEEHMIVQNLICHVRQPLPLILEMLNYMLSQVFVTCEMFILQRSLKGFVHKVFRQPNHPASTHLRTV